MVHSCSNERPNSMTFQGFVFSEETSVLTDQEFASASNILDWAARAVARRDAVAKADQDRAPIILADAGWHPDSQPSFELDGATYNAQTSYALLARKDRDIIRKMRLYGHSFTGYQLATLDLAEHRPWLSRKLPDNWDEILRFLAGPPDQAVFDYVSVAGALPERLRARPPRKFGEIGWLIDGAIVTDDTHSYQERLSLMYENSLIDHLDARLAQHVPLRMVEIGGGFGGLAYYLMQAFDRRLRYAIVDIPESLAFAGIYLATLFPDLENVFVEAGADIELPDTPGFTFIPNMDHHRLALGGRDVDLVINTLSLSEMSDVQIDDYCRAASRWIGSRGIFFEQNHQTEHRGPGDIPPRYFRNLHKCSSRLLPASFPKRRGDANFWVNESYRG